MYILDFHFRTRRRTSEVYEEGNLVIVCIRGNASLDVLDIFVSRELNVSVIEEFVLSVVTLPGELDRTGAGC